MQIQILCIAWVQIRSVDEIDNLPSRPIHEFGSWAGILPLVPQRLSWHLSNKETERRIPDSELIRSDSFPLKPMRPVGADDPIHFWGSGGAAENHHRI
jgi:hypothetical protein